MTSSVRTRARRATGVVLAAVCVIAPTGMVGAQAPPSQPSGPSSVDADVAPGEYVVMLRPDSAGSADRQSAAGDGLSSRIDAVLSRIHPQSEEGSKSEVGRSAAPEASPVIAELPVIDGFAVSLNKAEAAMLATDADVLSVEPNTKFELSTMPPPTEPPAPELELPWGLDRIDQPDLPLDGSYTPPNDGAGVTAYVIDNGVWAGHQEFGDRVLPLQNFTDDDPDPICMGHGSHVAGTIAGTNVGVAPEATIQPVRVFGCSSGWLIDILRGMDWVAQNAEAPAVANMSLGGPISLALDSAVKNMTARGITVVVAAGNDAVDACGYSPANAPAAITVAASTIEDLPAEFSNNGPCVDLFAPGEDVVSVDVLNAEGYVSMSGTSMASPHVAGTAALYLSAHPDASPGAVATAIVTGAVSGVVGNVTPRTPNKLVQVNGLPDPVEVGDNTPVAHITAPAGAGPVPVGSEITFNGGTSFDPQGQALTYEWHAQGQSGVVGTDSTFTTTVDTVGYYEVVLTVTNTDGVSATAAFEMEVDDLNPPQIVLDPTETRIMAEPGKELTWDASASFDPDGGDLTFQWYWQDLAGAMPGIEADGPTFSVTFPGGNYSLILIASNEYGVKAGQWIDVFSPANPVAVLTPSEITVVVGDEVTFDGSQSSDDTQFGPFYEWEVSDTEGVVGYESRLTRQFSQAGTYTVTLNVFSYTGESDSATAKVTVLPTPPAMTSVDPVRVLDTRLAHPEVPGPKGTVGAGKLVRFPVGGVPSSASGVMLNVTAVAPGGDGHFTVYPCGERPNTSNLNYYEGVTRGNSVLAMLTDGHELCIWTVAAADVVVDMTGYVRSDSPIHSMKPVRAFDSRKGPDAAKVKAGGVVEVPVTALSAVPDDASAVFVNLAAAGPSADGHLTAYPCGEVPSTSSLNYKSGETLSSSAVVAVSEAGTVCVRSHAETDVVVDVLGYVDAGDWMELSSERMFDTRAKFTEIAPKAKGAVAAGKMVKVDVGIDTNDAAGVFLTVTAVAPGADGHLTVYPCGDRPTSSGLNYRSGVTTSNMVFTKVDESGSVCVYTHATTDLVVDYAGYVTAAPAPENAG